MVDFKKAAKWFAGGVAGVIALSAAYYQGIVRKTSYQELPPAVRQSVDKQENLLESTLHAAVEDYKSGDLSSCQKKLREAISVVMLLVKHNEQFISVEDKLYRYQDIVTATQRAQDSLIKNKVFVEKIEIPPTRIDLVGIFQWTAHPQTIDALYSIHTQPNVINDPLMAKAILTAHLQMTEEYLSLTVLLREKLQKAIVMGGTEDVKTALKQIDRVIESLMNRLEDVKKELASFGK